MGYPASMSSIHLMDLDASALSKLIRSGSVSPVEAVEASLSRIRERNGPLNAFVHIAMDSALAEAMSSLL